MLVSRAVNIRQPVNALTRRIRRAGTAGQRNSKAGRVHKLVRPQLARWVTRKRWHQLVVRCSEPCDRTEVGNTVLIPIGVFGDVVRVDTLGLDRKSAS